MFDIFTAIRDELDWSTNANPDETVRRVFRMVPESMHADLAQRAIRELVKNQIAINRQTARPTPSATVASKKVAATTTTPKVTPRTGNTQGKPWHKRLSVDGLGERIGFKNGAWKFTEDCTLPDLELYLRDCAEDVVNAKRKRDKVAALVERMRASNAATVKDLFAMEDDSPKAA